MSEVKIIEIKKSIFEDNEKDAKNLRALLESKGIFLLNLCHLLEVVKPPL